MHISIQLAVFVALYSQLFPTKTNDDLIVQLYWSQFSTISIQLFMLYSTDGQNRHFCHFVHNTYFFFSEIAISISNSQFLSIRSKEQTALFRYDYDQPTVNSFFFHSLWRC